MTVDVKGITYEHFLTCIRYKQSRSSIENEDEMEENVGLVHERWFKELSELQWKVFVHISGVLEFLSVCFLCLEKVTMFSVTLNDCSRFFFAPLLWKDIQ